MTGTAHLVLEDGRIFTGTEYGAVGETLGEAVFSTGMSGYQETLTDPSYHRQIVVATAPQIGNTGWNHEGRESRGDRIWVAGYAVRDPSPRASNWRATGTLEDELRRQRIVGIAGIDTRAVVRHLRDRGSMKAGVFSGAALADADELLRRVRSQPSMLGADLAGEVSTSETTWWNPKGRNGSPSWRWTWASRRTPAQLRPARASGPTCCRHRPASSRSPTSSPTGCSCPTGRATRRPPTTSSRSPAMSSAPGSRCSESVSAIQILGRALGRSTYKMVFGHRGINVPVIDHATGCVAITAQNHGFALEGEAGERFDTDFGPAVVSHTCANDGVVEGIKLVDGSAFSVQYHPEAAAGPHDANYLFDQFVELMEGKK